MADCGRVEASEVLGAETIIHGVLQSGERLAASLRGLHRVSRGESIGFEVDPGDVLVFDESGAAFPLQRPRQSRNADLTGVFEPSRRPAITAVSAKRSSQVATADVAVGGGNRPFAANVNADPCPFAP